MSFEAAACNRKSPVLLGALGRAWLAFCPEEERRSILRAVSACVHRPALTAALERIRRDGYAFTAAAPSDAPARHGRADPRQGPRASAAFPCASRARR